MPGVSSSRRLRTGLIRRFYPTLDVCDDFSLRSAFTTPDADASIVSAVIWVDGRVTANDLQTRYQTHRATDPWVLEKCIDTKFGIMVARELQHSYPFQVTRHIVEVSSAVVYNPTACDIDEHSQYGQKAKFQKVIAGVLSRKLQVECPPWEIVLIPIQIPVQQQHQPVCKITYKTCCVLRFHHVLLRDRKTNQFLENVFDQHWRGKQKSQDPLATIKVGLKILKLRLSQWTLKIGRASCRERV